MKSGIIGSLDANLMDFDPTVSFMNPGDFAKHEKKQLQNAKVKNDLKQQHIDGIDTSRMSFQADDVNYDGYNQICFVSWFRKKESKVFTYPTNL